MIYKRTLKSSAFVSITTYLVCALTGSATAAAIDDIKIEISSDICDGSGAGVTSFVVYGTNTNTAKRVSGNFQYDTNPSGQSFPIFNADLAQVTDQFPKFHEFRFAPGQRAMIGCTYTYRASPQPRIVAAIPVVTTLKGAVYVDPSKPEPPAEEARLFAAFFLQHGYVNGCAETPLPDGLLYAIDLHPYRSINLTLESNSHGGSVGKLAFPIPAFGGTRTLCKDGGLTVGRVTDVEFTNGSRSSKTQVKANTKGR
jgi:hypothetical protein